MGCFKVECRLSGVFEADFVVDTGAVLSNIPSHVVDQIEVLNRGEDFFIFGDGTQKKLQTGDVLLEIVGHSRPKYCPVSIGPESSPFLLGATALEGFGLSADPINFRLFKAPLLMAGFVQGERCS